MTKLSDEAIDTLRNRVRGRVIVPEDPDYDKVRALWNAMIDRRPAVIVECSTSADVVSAISFAREKGIELSVRGAGHNIAGNALCDDGLAIDFSGMKGVRVDPEQRRAWVQPGATLSDFDEAVQPHGLATPVGINSTTGIAGLTLGGGFGWLTRKYGLTIDNLVAADLVTADGRSLRASDNENPDLFWAIRGGGGNFGVVTEFEFQLHPVGPEVLAGLIVFPLDQAGQVLRRYREFMRSAPVELNVWVVLRKAPPLPFLPEAVHGSEVVVFPVFYVGDPAKGEQLVDSVRSFGDSYGEHVGVQPYVQWQKAFDPLLTPGARNYWKSHNFTQLDDGALDCMVDYASRLPSPHCEIFVGSVKGVANEVPADAMAYAHREAQFVLNVHGRWEHPSDDGRCIAWAREFFEASKPYASSGAYVNFMTEDEGERVTAAYGINYDRLREIKRRYDPDNVFHFNHNIRP